MAWNCFSSQDVCVEALFEETNNVCICSRAHLKDYHYTSRDYNTNPFDDDCGVCYEEIPEDTCEDTSDSNYQALKEFSEDPEMPYDDTLDEEFELMKSMGLPTSFGKKPSETRNYNGFYSAYDHDNYEEYDDENEQSDKFEESYQYSERFNIDKSDNKELNNTESCENSRVEYNENNKNVQENSRTGINSVLNFQGNASEFQSFWTLHGDTICLNSWIEKYKDFIAPEFLERFKQCDNFQEIANSDIWSSSINQSVMQCDSSYADKKMDSETFQDSCADGIVLDNSSDNCDPALKNMNDKFESMSFSDVQTELMSDDENIKCDNENPESREDDPSLDGYELYSESILPYTMADFENIESKIDFQEVEVETSGSEFHELSPADILSALAASSNSLNELDAKSNKLSTSEDEKFDADFAILKENCPEIVNEKQTQNPLFICTKTDDEYEAEIKSRSWEELWFAHCQEEFDKHSKFFSENSITKSKESDFSKCKYCGEINCLVCNSEYKNGNDSIKVPDLFNKVTLSDFLSKNDLSCSNKILAYPVTDNYISKDISLPNEASLFEIKLNDPLQMNNEDFCDDEVPMELPIKRLHEIESENEEPEDTIKELGLIIRPTKSLRIKKKKRRVRKSHLRQLKTHFQIDDTEEDNKMPEGSEQNSDNLNIESNEENESKITEETDKLTESKGSEQNSNNLNVEENESRITEEADKLIESKVEEEIKIWKSDLDENMEAEESAPLENTEAETGHASQNVEFCKDKNVLQKYWHQRYRLFHRFDEGIQLDEESWFSVTPERIARHIAERCACGVMVDAFCGAGGNAIQFASVCYHVIAIDKDPKKIELAKHNATVYGVADFIDFVVGDYLDLAPYLKADGVFLSPPWGGPSYAADAEYSIDKIEPDVYKTFEVSRKITENIALFVPKNTIINQLVELSGEGNSVEIEQNFLNKKVKTITAYYGEFVNQRSVEKDESS